jgi:hypothetical protein
MYKNTGKNSDISADFFIGPNKNKNKNPYNAKASCTGFPGGFYGLSMVHKLRFYKTADLFAE